MIAYKGLGRSKETPSVGKMCVLSVSIVVNSRTKYYHAIWLCASGTTSDVQYSVSRNRARIAGPCTNVSVTPTTTTTTNDDYNRGLRDIT